LKRYDDAVCILGEQDLKASKEEVSDDAAYPSLLYLFFALKNCVQLRVSQELLSSIEMELRGRTAQAYARMGCATLAAEQLALLLGSRASDIRKKDRGAIEIKQEQLEIAASFFGNVLEEDETGEVEEEQRSKDELGESSSPPSELHALGGIGGLTGFGAVGGFGMLGSSGPPSNPQYDFLSTPAQSTAPANNYDFLNSSVAPSADDNKYDFLGSSSAAGGGALDFMNSTAASSAAPSGNALDFLSGAAAATTLVAPGEE
jgi:hypothetical protein